MTPELIFIKAIYCAAHIMHLSVPEQPEFTIQIKNISTAECNKSIRAASGCGALFYGDEDIPHIIVSSKYVTEWSLWVHEGCHYAQWYNKLHWRGAGAELMCDYFDNFSHICKPGGPS